MFHFSSRSWALILFLLLGISFLTTDAYLILHTIFNLEKGIEILLKFHFNEAR